MQRNLLNEDNDTNLKKWFSNVVDEMFSPTFENDHEVLKLPKELLSNGNLFDEISENDFL